MKRNRWTQVFLFICIISMAITPAFAGLDFEATATSDLTMSFVQRPDVDVVLTIGNSDYDVSTFKEDLTAKLSALGVEETTVEISSLEVNTTSSNDADAADVFNNWTNYPSNVGKWKFENGQIFSTVNTSWTGYWEDDESISDVDFTCDFGQFNDYDNDNIGVTFRMNVGETPTNLNDYAYYAYVSDANGAIDSGLYKKTFGQSTYSMTQLVRDSHVRARDTWYHLQVKMTGGHIEIYRDGAKVMDYVDSDPLPAGGYGVFTYSQRYGYFKNIGITSKTVFRFSEVIRQPSWRDSAERFVINLDDELIGDFEDEMALSEILYRTLNEDIHYIGWGNNGNEDQAKAFIADNNGMGSFLNRDTTDYDAALDQLAAYIAGRVNAKTITSKAFDADQPDAAVGRFIANRPISVEVDPSSLKTNTVTTEYPNGRWRVNHDPEYYVSSGGYPGGSIWWDNEDQDDLPTEYTQAGSYDFYFEDTKVSKVNFHRQPVAKFSFNTADNTISDQSYDMDGEIVARAWKWKEVTATSSTEVSDRSWNLTEPKPSDFIAGREYIVQLRVLDSQNTWSRTTSKYISTATTITSVPIADFSISTDYLQKHLGTTITYTDKSYDPQGRSIVDALWTVTDPDGSKIHEGSEPMTDFASSAQGTYTIQLKVKNDLDVWSEVYTKTLTVVDDLESPTIAISEEAGSLPRNPWELTLTFADEGGSGFKRQSVSLTNTDTGEVTSLGWSSAKTKNLALSDDGIWTITAVAEDQKGNTSTKTFTGYIVDATAPSAPSLSGAPQGWISTSATITASGSTDANGVTYQMVIADDTPDEAAWVNGSSRTVSSAGSFRIWARALDAANNGSEPVSVWVKIDKTAPVFTSVPADKSMEVGGDYKQDAVAAEDAESGLKGSIAVDDSAVVTGTVGDYKVKYTATNNAGLSAVEFQTVSVVDTTLPVLHLTGEKSVDVEVEAASYTDAGATATDNYDDDGILTAAVKATDNINLKVVADYQVTYNVTDANGNKALPISRDVHVVDTTSPVLHLTGASTAIVEVHGDYKDAGATVTDNYDAADVITKAVKASDDINLDKVGAYTVTYKVTDASGNAAEPITRTVKVVDTTAPVIAVEGANPVDTEVHMTYKDAGASATDNYDGADAITLAIKASQDLNIHLVGPYTVTYNVTDANGNAAIPVTRRVNVVDTTIPVLHLTGEKSVVVEVYGDYKDAGATATDNYDTADAITKAVKATDNINLKVVADYQVTYNVTDANGNAAEPITRDVHVVDTTAPVLTLTGLPEVFMDQGDPYKDAGATATDNYDSAQAITAAIKLTNPLDINTIGEYSLQYDVTDANGNQADAITRLIHVVHPLALSTDEADQIRTTGASFQGSIDHYGVKPVLEHGFVFDRNSANTSLENAEGILQLGAASEAGPFQADADLSSGQVYYVRAYAVKAEGVVYGQAMEVRTPSRPAKPVAVQTFGETSVISVNPDRLAGQIQTDESGTTALQVESETTTRRQLIEVPLPAIDQINAIAARDGGLPELQIDTPIGTMNLPTSNLGSSTLLPEGSGENARIHIAIEGVDEETEAAMEAASGTSGLVQPVRFEVSLKSDTQIDERTNRVETRVLDSFESLVPRSIKAPEGDQALMAAVFDEETQSWMPVLSRMFVDENGNREVEILHQETGTYTLMPMEVKAVLGIEGHPAQEDIEMLAGLDILPVEAGTSYQADIGITRQEMAYVMVRLLGITQAQGELISYPDVAAGDAYEREIRLASQSGIFKGYEDGSFRGDQIISREELAAVLERALIYMEMTDGLDPEAASRFADADLIGFWSVDSVGRLTDAGLVEFELNASYRPQEQATKAEVALMVANFLRMIGMIQ